MFNPDFSDRTYTAEVIRIKTKAAEALRSLWRLTREPRHEFLIGDQDTPVNVRHGYVASRREHHRVERTIMTEEGNRIQIPRRIGQGRGEGFLYDVLIAQSHNHIVVAVPFHDLAEQFFVQADDALAGTGARYEKVDITRLIVRLDSDGVIDLPSKSGSEIALSITRCHLVYSDPDGRNRNLQQIQLTGTNLGATPQYRSLIAPVVSPRKADTLKAAPVVLGFALSFDGVRKSSAVTDRHGNFKLWVSPGLRRLSRLFNLLETVESMENVASTTSNVPILQSGLIRGAEEK